MTEPADLTFVRTGDKWPYTFWWRDDETASLRKGEEHLHWWDVADEDGEEPKSWDELSRLPDPQLVHFVAIQDAVAP